MSLTASEWRVILRAWLGSFKYFHPEGTSLNERCIFLGERNKGKPSITHFYQIPHIFIQKKKTIPREQTIDINRAVHPSPLDVNGLLL